MIPTEDQQIESVIDASLGEEEREGAKSLHEAAGWLGTFWPYGDADCVIEFLESCVDFLRLPMHPDNANDREGVAGRLFEAMQAKLTKINRQE